MSSTFSENIICSRASQAGRASATSGHSSSSFAVRLRMSSTPIV
eukprot:CAMPEP_0114226226 /NCGR_PEP_ID=MMETSP0058-20121206/1120_1 /TAXON_ID=36894 /ORGANISM="Pyramimonas parkeae, CCMP726" /LENGTH=43 /DNA_ID= /DNA_START= /DNA_END= /DNA_ORIENTATION=